MPIIPRCLDCLRKLPFWYIQSWFDIFQWSECLEPMWCQTWLLQNDNPKCTCRLDKVWSQSSTVCPGEGNSYPSLSKSWDSRYLEAPWFTSKCYHHYHNRHHFRSKLWLNTLYHLLHRPVFFFWLFPCTQHTYRFIFKRPFLCGMLYWHTRIRSEGMVFWSLCQSFSWHNQRELRDRLHTKWRRGSGCQDYLPQWLGLRGWDSFGWVFPSEF